MKTKINRRTILKTGAVAVGMVGMPAILRAADTVKVGLSIPITGLQAILGETLLNCYKLAADELNAANGIGGRQVQLIVEDDQTTTKGSIDKARKLVFEDKVDVVMGTIISPERSATLSVTSRAKKLFFYPTNFEGGECNKYFVATGPIPMQQVDPMMPWVAKNLGKTIYVMASDYAWPQKMTEAIGTAYDKSGGKIIGADYFPFGTQDFGPAFQKIKQLKPDVVWSMVVGNDAVTQLKQYRSFDIQQPLIAPLDEVFNKDALPPGVAAGTYAPQPYWMALDNPVNKKFIAGFRKRFGDEKMVNGIGEAGYDGLHLYALAAEKAGSLKDDDVLAALPKVEFDAPQGPVKVDPANNHTVVHSYVGQAEADGISYKIVEDFGAISPVTPYCKV